MTDGTIELTRRKILAATGAVGAAGAGAGMGTSAFFSDEESFEDNQLTAGALDLKVDWEEHYADWSDDEAEAAPGVRMVDDPDEVGDEETALPDPENPLVAVPDDQLSAFMDATAIEAYPDTDGGGDGDGVQDDLEAYDACEDFADMDEDLDPTGGNGAGSRTLNDDTVDADGNPKPLVSLDDVKPGDFGELTLSFHLCDNPGYVWLQGGLASAAENGWTEPEADDPNETGNATDSVSALDEPAAGNIEILDEIRTLLWYDEDGDNVYDPGSSQEPVDVMLVFDKSESMNAQSGADDDDPGKLSAAIDGGKTLVDALGDNVRVGLTVFADETNTGVARSLGSSAADIKADLDGLAGPQSYRSGSKINDDGGPDSNDADNLNFETRTGVGINAARQELLASNPDSKKIMVILSDGKPFADPLDADQQAADAKDDGIELYTIAYGDDAAVSQMAGWASDPTDTHAFVAPGAGDLGNVFGQIGRIIAGEECFWRGSLRELLAELESGNGIPLDGNRDTAYEELADPPDAESREAFVDATNNFLGFAWYLPTDVGNRIQSDSVAFDLGFYTEQARHNDGSGPSTSTPTS